jgi:hypothetical protein
MTKETGSRRWRAHRAIKGRYRGELLFSPMTSRHQKNSAKNSKQPPECLLRSESDQITAIPPTNCDVRFTPESGHVRCN